MDGKKTSSYVFSNGLPVIDIDGLPPAPKNAQQERLTELLNDKDVTCAANGLAIQLRETYDSRTALQDIDLNIYKGLAIIAPNYTGSMLKSGNWGTPSILKEGAYDAAAHIKDLPAETQEKLNELVGLYKQQFPYQHKLYKYMDAHPNDFNQPIQAIIDGLQNKKTPGCPDR